MGFKSKYGPNENLSIEKYLTELMCERKAKKEKRTLLHFFWREDYWKKFYAQQIIAAKALLKLYSEKAILNAINNKTVNWVYSLRSPQLIPILADEENKIKRQLKLQEEKQQIEEQPKAVLEEKQTVEIRQNNNKKESLINKLRNI
mgnify:CR=1 FL=1